jgi:integrase
MNTKIVILRTKLNSEGKATIYVQYNYQKSTLRLSTQEKISPKDFDTGKQVVKKSCTSYSEINDSIHTVRGKVESIIRTSRLKNIEPTTEYVFNIYHGKDKSKEEVRKNKTVLELLKDWISYSQNIKKTNKGTKIRINTIRNYGTLSYHLNNYFSERNINLAPDKLDSNFYEEYTNFLQDEYEGERGTGISLNSIANNIKLIKVFLGWVEKQGYKINQEYKEFKVTWRPADIIVLEWEEIQQILKHNLKSIRLQNVRDLLIIGCSTGLRISDLLNLTRENIDLTKKEIRLTTIKTEQPITVPIIEIAVPILERYIVTKSKKLFNISAQKFNDYLKELGELVGINKPITRVTFQGGRRKDTVIPKYTLMTSHICRRTYITELLKRKVPAEIIMQASGHRDYNSFKKYIKLATEDVKSQITEAFSKCL